MPAHDLTVHPLDGYPAELGAALWMMEDIRRRTLRAMEGLDDALVDALPEGAVNTIGSLLYHVAAVEADWLYADVLNQPYPHWLEEVFPYDVREEDGRLTRIPPAPLAQHLSRLALVRQHFLTDIRLLTVEDTGEHATWRLEPPPPNGCSIISASTRVSTAARSRPSAAWSSGGKPCA